MTVKSVLVNVQPDGIRGPGWAWLTLSGVVDGADSVSPEPADWALTLQRNQDSYFLVNRNSWGAGEVWHPVHAVQMANGSLQLLLGPELLDAVLADPSVVCRVHVRGQGPAQGLAFAGVLRFSRGLMPSGASGQSPVSAQQAPPVKPVEPVVESPVVMGEVRPEAVAASVAAPVADTSRRRWPWLLLLLLMLLAAGGSYWWWQQSQMTDPGQNAVSGGSEMPAACSAQALQAATDDLIFLQACVATKPDSDAVLAVIDAAKQANRCDLIQRLYAHQAQAGQEKVALAYAREFDPSTFKGGCFKQADVQTALYWYENILQANPGRADIAARVKELEAMK